MTVTAQLIEANRGLLGYRLTQGTMWTGGGGDNDWSGLYIATTLDQAKGYVDIANGTVRVWTCTLVANYPFWCIHGQEIADPAIDSGAKADLVAAAIQAANNGTPTGRPLIPSLCQNHQGYIGPDAEENEIILGWGCINAIAYVALRDYRVRNHMIDGWSVPDMNNWQPMATEPAAPPSPVPC
ncbi:MAG: hypothetical protein R3B09_30495 [Nannocystaceae bacterium]